MPSRRGNLYINAIGDAPRSIIMMRRAFPHGPRPPSPATCRTISRRRASAPSRSNAPRKARTSSRARRWRRTRP